jgi:hypothetical protein
MPSRRVSSAYGSRPGSAAWKELRGSRPNSALVAQQIEGYDSDFLVGAGAPFGRRQGRGVLPL